MKKNLLIALGMAVILFIYGYICCIGSVIAVEHKSSIIEHYGEKEEVSESIEVGNKICPITGRPVDIMDGPFKFEYEGKIFNVCCKMCLREIKEYPEKYIKIIKEMMKEERNENE